MALPPLSPSQRRQQGNRLLATLSSRLTGIIIFPSAFSREPNGRPVCDTHDIHVSLSHSGQWLCGIAALSPCGVDIEQVKPQRDWQSIWQAVRCDKEPLHLNTPEEFYHYWTQKEALWKAYRQPKRTLSQTDTHDCHLYSFVPLPHLQPNGFIMTACIKEE